MPDRKAEDKLSEIESRLEDVTRMVSDWVWEADDAFRLTYVSMRVFEDIGFHPHELIGRSLTKLGTFDDHRTQEELWWQVPFRDEPFKIDDRNGEQRSLRLSGLPVFDHLSGRLKAVRGTARDVTDRLRAEAGKLASEQRFRDIVESTTDWFWEMGPDLRLTYVSDRHFEMTGRSPGDVLGKTIMEIGSPGEREREAESRAELWRVLDRRQPFRDSERLIAGQDGREIYLNISGRPIFDEDGAFLGYRGAATDITLRKTVEEELQKVHRNLERRVNERTKELRDEIAERRLAEAQLKIAKESADAANRAKSEFLSCVSHELRTPLNAVIGFSEAITEEIFGAVDNEKYVEYAAHIHDSGSHLLKLINDILDISLIDAGRMELYLEELDLAKISEDSVKMIESRAKSTGVTLANRIDGELGFIRADERRVKQILLNLLSNAVKFTPQGGSVFLTAALGQDATVEISVADTGIGMSADEIGRAAELFNQSSAVVSRNEEGTGLGLALTKRLAEAHGGSLSIVSAEGAGTTVTIRLPIDPSDCAGQNYDDI